VNITVGGTRFVPRPKSENDLQAAIEYYEQLTPRTLPPPQAGPASVQPLSSLQGRLSWLRSGRFPGPARL